MTYQVFNKTEESEKRYLEQIKRKLHQAINDTDSAVNAHAREMQESKDYLWENKAGMDHVEKVSVRQSITQIALTGEGAVAKKKRLAKLLNTPYFGRIDFTEKDNGKAIPLYIGIHTFFDQHDNQNLIHDWRAPVSGMFYDFELGAAHYESPSGEVEGEIKLKRQYRIRGGAMEFMLENSLNIHDDVLQKELSQNSSERMKNIVATIQRDQNAIIRNEDARALVIQGVAGSGKTSVALHRIAFLLYRFKETISSRDILIISPNKVFADYISNVLPELGEEKIQETSMEELAANLLENKYKFESFAEQVSALLTKEDAAFRERIRFKAGFDFISKISVYLVHVENTFFTPKLVMVKRYPIPETYLQEKFNTYRRLPLLKRIPEMVKDIVNDLDFYNRYEATTAERNQLRKDIEKMFKTLNLRKLYKDFYDWLGKPEMLKAAKGSVYEYADVFPIIYLKVWLEGAKILEGVKHLVVDEMQDYTAVQYSIMAKLFPCNKTILGDSNQSVNPFSSSDMESISRVFPNALQVTMVKSYRSTYEITELAQRIRHNEHLVPIERHGEKPVICYCKSPAEEVRYILDLIGEFETSTNNTLGIICKTQQQASKLYEKLNGSAKRMHLLDFESTSFLSGVIVSTAFMSKGLEFDQVIVPHCDAKNYHTSTDRQMLYVAVTRAMHGLHLTHTGEGTALLKDMTKLPTNPD